MENDTHDTSLTPLHVHQPCDDCGSSDALTINTNGSTKCYSCGTFKAGSGEEKGSDEAAGKTKKTLPLLSGTFASIKDRGITLDTCKKWGVEVVSYKGEPHIAFPYFNNKGQKVAQKVRGKGKEFKFLGETKNPTLFGSQLWNKGKRIVITEGELDALSVSQAMGHKWPVVSIPNGAHAAKKSISQNIQWIDENFAEVVLMFDMDEVGQAAAREVAGLFPPSKCRIASLPCKDANECLTTGKTEDLIQAVWNAAEFRPDGIVTVEDILPRLDQKPTMGRDLPWDSLTKLTYGLKSPSVWIWTSGSGMGKTEFFKAMMAKLLNDGVKVGAILLEEEVQDTVVDMAGKMVNKCFNSPDVTFDMKERDEAINTLKSSGNLYLYDHFGHDDYEAIRAVIRHMVVGYGCEVIFLDHITAFTDGQGDGANALAERIMKELASMTRELKFNLQVISHVRKTDNSRKPTEEGGRVKIDDLKGSGAIKQWANVVIGLERNQQSEDAEEARTTTVRLLKARGAGKNVGRTVLVKYLPETGELLEIDEANSIEGFETQDLPF